MVCEPSADYVPFLMRFLSCRLGEEGPDLMGRSTSEVWYCFSFGLRGLDISILSKTASLYNGEVKVKSASDEVSAFTVVPRNEWEV